MFIQSTEWTDSIIGLSLRSVVPMEMASQIFDMARMQVAKASPNLVHPLLCLDAIQFGLERGAMAGLAKVGEFIATGGGFNAAGGEFIATGGRFNAAGGKLNTAGGKFNTAGSQFNAAGGKFNAAGGKFNAAGDGF
eukprot:1194281-Prorocentrum_minimum.AAC.1